MDHRDVAANLEAWYEKFDEKSMTATVELEIGDGDVEEVQVKVKYVVCPTCNGKGSHVNPSIDSRGISAEEFAEDPDFAEDYSRGMYDQPCNECEGRRVVPEIDEEACDLKVAQRVREKITAALSYARERTHELEMGY